MKEEYLTKITELIKQCSDLSLLDLVYKILQKEV